MTRPRIALLGLGIMGSGMAGRLLRAGFPLTVYNRSRERAQALASAGAGVAATAREAATAADIVIAMVADDAASRAVWLGHDGALSGVGPGTLLLESSTVTVDWVHELAAAAAASGCELLDAPVAGSKPQVAAGELVFMIGGSASAVDRVREILAVMGRAIVHVGPSGSGARLKLLNNLLAAVQAVSFAEALAVIENSGLNQDAALQVLTNGAPGSPVVKMMATRMTARQYTPPNFALRWMLKDVRYAIDEVQRHGVRFDTAVAACDLVERAMASGHADEDFSVIVEPLRESR